MGARRLLQDTGDNAHILHRDDSPAASKTSLIHEMFHFDFTMNKSHKYATEVPPSLCEYTYI